jgi:Alw26I/Eco31I/Esp3I family type II restriction endonuclease
MMEAEWKEESERAFGGDSPSFDGHSFSDGRRDWHDNFLEYAYFIANHPNFEGMPHAIDDAGRVMWNAPSERPEGSRFSDLNDQRRAWWRQKANEIGINPSTSENWLSDTAKAINPTDESVCQICGQTLDIRYVYLNGHSVRKFNELLPEDEQVQKTDLLTIFDAVDILVDAAGDEGFEVLEDCFEELEDVPRTRESFKKKLDELVGKSQFWTSPGKMANPPDRLDGFHSYGICCRSREDTGRHRDNLSQYNQDRRAFEQWVDGNWSAASKLMSKVGYGKCQYPPCDTVDDLTADHIGPISLGFKHSTLLTGLCSPHNSGMNRRLNTWKVNRILEAEQDGMQVASRHIQRLWNECKREVDDDEEAKELSNQLRYNQHHYLIALEEIRKRGHEDILMCFLEPEYSRHTYEFEGLDPVTLDFDRMVQSERNSTYADSLGSRMVRIAFNSLEGYAEKGNRNMRDVDTPEVQQARERFLTRLGHHAENDEFRQGVQEAFEWDADNRVEQSLHTVFDEYGYKPPSYPQEAVDAFYDYMDAIGEELASRYRQRTS